MPKPPSVRNGGWSQGPSSSGTPYGSQTLAASAPFVAQLLWAKRSYHDFRVELSPGKADRPATTPRRRPPGSCNPARCRDGKRIGITAACGCRAEEIGDAARRQRVVIPTHLGLGAVARRRSGVTAAALRGAATLDAELAGLAGCRPWRRVGQPVWPAGGGLRVTCIRCWPASRPPRLRAGMTIIPRPCSFAPPGRGCQNTRNALPHTDPGWLS